MAASAHSSCMWMLVLGACVSLVAGTDCGKECALCVYRLLGQQSALSSLISDIHIVRNWIDANVRGVTAIVGRKMKVTEQSEIGYANTPLYPELNASHTYTPQGGSNGPRQFACTCSLECDGGLDSQKLRLCQDLLLEEENQNPLAAQQEQEAAADVAAADDEDAALPEHQMAKKYGGFMKRYGGFMSRRSSSSSSPPEGALEEAGNQDEEENIRMEILKVLNAATEHGGGGGGGGEGEGGEAAKRYGGFMRRADGGAAQGNLLEAVLGRGLKKRYGGFMRRVGRPEWLVDSSKNGGVLKRAWESGSELQKRYGGFMD